MLKQAETPTREELVTDLKLLREKGLPEIDDLTLAALLEGACKVIPTTGETDEAAAVETLLRRAVGRLSGGRYGESLTQLFGLDRDARALTAGVRRANAAQALGCSLKTFLRKHENPMLLEVARQILVLCNEQRMRGGREHLAAKHPVASEIAAHWIEMFQAYYRTWSPICGLGNDLTAYRSTLIEDPRPYDRRFGTRGPDDPGYSQEEQAEGYARFALYHYAKFEWELRRFQAVYGGLWLLSNADVEIAVRDAVYRISWHIQPFNERDQSFLRTVVDEATHQELHAFLSRLAGSDLGQNLHREWEEWVATCDCTWAPAEIPENSYFPTTSNASGISVECQVHQVVDNCALYCQLIDEDWLKIADWYHLTDETKKAMSAERLYADWRSTSEGADYHAPT